MSYPSDRTDEQWDLVVPVFNAPGKRGRNYAAVLRHLALAQAQRPLQRPDA